MTTLDELQKENQKLKTREQNRREINKIDFERNKLIEENKRLKNPGIYEFGKKVKFFGKATKELVVGTGKGIAKTYNKYEEKHKSLPVKKQSSISKGLKNLSKVKVKDLF